MNENNLNNENNNQSEQNVTNNQFETTNSYNENFQRNNDNKKKTNIKRLFIIVIICIVLPIVLSRVAIKAVMYFIDEKYDKPIETNNNINVDIDDEEIDTDDEEDEKEEKDDEINETKDDMSDEEKEEFSAEFSTYDNKYISYLIGGYPRKINFPQKYYENEYGYFFKKDSLLSSDVNHEIKVISALRKYINETKLDYKSLTNEQKISCFDSIYNFKDNKKIDSISNDCFTVTVDEKNIISVMKNMFGEENNSILLNNKWYNDFYFLVKYDKSNKKFKLAKSSSGIGGPLDGIKYDNIKTTYDKDYMYVTLNTYMFEYCGDDENKNINYKGDGFCYVIYKGIYSNKDKLLGYDYEYIENNKIKSEHLNKFDKYKFTFKKNSNGYYTFIKVEKQ